MPTCAKGGGMGKGSTRGTHTQQGPKRPTCMYQDTSPAGPALLHSQIADVI